MSVTCIYPDWSASSNGSNDRIAPDRNFWINLWMVIGGVRFCACYIACVDAHFVIAECRQSAEWEAITLFMSIVLTTPLLWSVDTDFHWHFYCCCNYCVTFAESEPYCCSRMFVCLFVCLMFVRASGQCCCAAAAVLLRSSSLRSSTAAA